MTTHRHSLSGKYTSSTDVPIPSIAGLAKQVDLDALAARVAALETAPLPPPPVPPSPLVDLPGWKLVFADEFDDRTVAKGHFTDGGTIAHWTAPDGTTKTSGTLTADKRYIAFGNGTSLWPDTTGHGYYGDPAVISIANGVFTEEVYVDGIGKGRACTVTPQPTGGSNRGGLVGMRWLVRLRADKMPGFKVVPLLWRDDGSALGEIDWPEASTDALPKGYFHYSATAQSYAAAPVGTSLQDWHDYVGEWVPGVSIEFFLDGVSVAKFTTAIPTVAMHFNLQFETSTDEPAPAPGTTGLIQIERVGLWAPA
jgi:hypothetical protein